MEYESHFFDLSLSQMDIYLEQIKAINSPKFNIGGYLKLYDIDRDRLSMAHQKLVEQFDSFGIRLSGQAHEPCQTITRQRTLSLPRLDFSAEVDARAKALCWVNEAFSEPFEFIGGELFKSWLITIDDSESWYVGIAHHIINDGFGFVNWTKRLAEIYAGACVEQHLCWQDVVASDKDYLNSEKFLHDKQHWSQRMAASEGAGLTHVHPVGDNDGRQKTSGREVRQIGRKTYDQWVALAKEQGLSFYHVIVAAIAIYAFRSENTRHVAIGIPIHNRHGVEQKNAIGVFTNITPVSLDIDEQMSVLDVASRVKARQKQDIRHNRFPLGRISQLANLNGAGRNVFDISFNYLKMGAAATFGGRPSELFYLSHYHDDTPLNITLWESGEARDIELQFDHNLGYFNSVEAGRLAQRILFFVEQCCHGLTENICRLPLLPEQELKQVRQFADAPFDGGLPSADAAFVHQAFEAQVERTPDNIALVGSDGMSLSYAGLNRRANRLARQLHTLGVGKGDPVVLCSRAGCEAAVGILAILKAGALCVPVDLNYPVERIRYAIAQSGSRYLLLDEQAAEHEKLSDMDHGCDTIDLCAEEAQAAVDEDWQNIDPNSIGLTPDDAAYIIYTSGSTGKSKGVEVQHRAFAGHMLNINRCYGVGGDDRCLQTASISFDAALEQLFVPLTCGASVHFVDLRHKDVDGLIAFIEQRRITVADFTASYVAEFLNICDSPRPQPLLRLLIVGNECFYSAVLRRCLAANLADRVINAYGPTETVITSTVYEVSKHALPQGSTVPIGKAVPGNRTWVLGQGGEPAPLGCVGELCVSGENLARRYIGDEALTAEKFTTEMLVPGRQERLYRTGDLVRYRDDGNIEYIGRKDGQLKIRGHRVELLEIESSLLDIPQVKQAVVQDVNNEQGRGQLVAYIVPNAALEQTAELVKTVKSGLRAKLPDYMVPSRIVVRVELPLLPNGKVDLGALSDGTGDEDVDIIHATTPVEVALAQLWRQILSVDEVDIHTSFFGLGGDSLSAIRLNAMIKKALSVAVPVEVIFQYPTIHEMAMNIELIRDRAAILDNDIQSQFNTGGFL